MRLVLVGTAAMILGAATAVSAGAPGPAEEPGVLDEVERLRPRVDEASAAGRYEDAATLTRELLEIREAVLGPDHLDVATTLTELAGRLEELGDFEAARPMYERALAIREATLGPDHPEVASSLNDLAGLLRVLGTHEAALPLYERALAIREAVFGLDHPDVAATLNDLATLRLDQGDYRAARLLYERALAIREATSDPNHPDVAQGLNNLAWTLRALGQHEAARPMFLRALAIREAVLGPDHPDVATTLNNFALLVQDMGEGKAARSMFERALAIREAAFGPDHPKVATSLNNLGTHFYGHGDYDAARPLYERALAIREAVFGPHHPLVATTVGNLAVLHEAKGDFETARLLHERALAIREAAFGPHHPSVALGLHNLAGLLLRQGDYDEARLMYERVLAIKEGVLGPGHPSVAMSLNDLAAVLRADGDHEASRRADERAIAILEEAFGRDHPEVATSLNNLACLLLELGDHEAARPLFERALAIRVDAFGPDHPDVAFVLNNLAWLSAAQGDREPARTLYERALAIWVETLGPDHPHVARTLGNLAELLEADADYEAARMLRARSFKLSTGYVLGVLDSLGEREAIALVQRERWALDAFLATFDRPSDAVAAYDAALTWKGLSGRIARSRNAALLASGDAEVARHLDELNTLRGRVSDLVLAEFDPEKVEERRAQLGELTTAKEAAQRELARVSPAFGMEREVARARTADVCHALPDGSAMVDILKSRGHYIAFVLTAASCSPRRVDLGPVATMDTLVERHRGLLDSEAPLSSRVERAGGALRELLWDPLQSHLDGASRVIVVPDGALNAVAFGAIPVSGDHYLLEDLVFAYAESAQDVVRWRLDERTPTSGALLVGGVDYGAASAGVPAPPRAAAAPLLATRRAPCADEPLLPLPQSSEEVRAIAALLPRREPVVLLSGSEATEAAVADAAQGKRVVHLATHGFFATGRCRSALAIAEEPRFARDRGVVGYHPMVLSGVVLAGADAARDPLDREDGIWTAEEVASLDLRGTEVVVLSACDTGLGEVVSGEGVLGLRRAFAVAGVRWLVMSLWEVPDEPTRQLMEDTYRRMLRRKGENPVRALRRAQLELLEENRIRHGEGRPWEWGAFVVAGPAWP